MGKRIIAQRRGRGSPTFRAHTFTRVAPARYPRIEGPLRRAEVAELVHDPGRGAPLAKIVVEDGTVFYNLAVEGLYVGEIIYIGREGRVENPPPGSILPLFAIPTGSLVCNVEKVPGDGGRYARASGAYATLLAVVGDRATLKLPSGKTIEVPACCLATIGVVAGGGRTAKPFMKAGNRWKLMRSRGRKYPIVKGVSMGAYAHPHGGGRHRRPGKPTTVSRHAPPGRKVGYIAAKKTGRGR